MAALNGAAGDTGTAAAQVKHSAGELSKQPETLHTAVDEFLTLLRAA